MKATIDRDGCIGCGLCENVCPAVFRMDDDGKAFVCGEVTPENEGCAFEAESDCPAGVIEITEE